jgi:hypothetical protein
MDGLIDTQQVGRGDTRPASAYIEGLGELNEFGTCRVPRSQEDGELDSNPRGVARTVILSSSFLLQLSKAGIHIHSTCALVQHVQFECQLSTEGQDLTYL